MCARNRAGVDAVPTNSKVHANAPVGPPSLRRIVRDSWDNRPYKGRHFRDPALCRGCVHPTPFLSTHLLNQLFEGDLFRLGENMYLLKPAPQQLFYEFLDALASLELVLSLTPSFLPSLVTPSPFSGLLFMRYLVIEY